MGLISRVSSRTYRKFITNFRFKKNILKNNKKWPSKIPPSPVNLDDPERLTSKPPLTFDERSCPPLSPKNCELNTTSDLCPSLPMTKSKSSEVNLRVSKPEKSSPFTERNTLFTLNEFNEKRPLVNLFTLV